MQKSVIIAVVEPISYSLNRSVAWAITSALKAKQTISLIDSSKHIAGTLIGILPILQPIRIDISGQHAFLLVMRAFVGVNSEMPDSFGTVYTLSADGAELASMSSGTVLSGYSNPFLLVAAELPAPEKADIVALSDYINFLAATLWQKEPINWTTYKLHLASNGQFMTSKEMELSDLPTGVPVFLAGSMQLTAGAKAVPFGFGQWAGAGAVMPAHEDASSSCTNTAASDSDTGGTGDGGDGGDGDGGDGQPEW